MSLKEKTGLSKLFDFLAKVFAFAVLAAMIFQNLVGLGCGHELMTPRFKAEKNIRSVERKETSDS